MIFVTLGTDHHPFSRLLRWVDAALESKKIGCSEDVIVQYGYTPCENRRYHCCAFLTFEEMLNYFRASDFVITHGSSTALLAARCGGSPIVVPRRRHLGEHVDDHQWRFVRRTQTLLPFFAAFSEREFLDALGRREEIKLAIARRNVGESDAVQRFSDAFNKLAK